MSRLLVATLGLVGMTVSLGGQPQAVPAATGSPAGNAPDRALFQQYCVSCHNERLKTAGLMLDKIDPGQVAENAPVLEKVVRKLRSGQMPPAGRPRPDPPARDALVAALEAALDAAAAAAPNPGRVPTHRLNRVEYVNAIRDLLALDVDGTTLLPADAAGFGFDNNADVLSVTPGLMARYLSAATKISRLAIGSREIRPAIQVYRAPEFGRQIARAGEDLPFGTHGGLAFRHTFPLDGEYGFRIRLQRNLLADTIRGIDEEHDVEVRLDRALVQRFKVGGAFQGVDPGILIAVPEDDVYGKELHDYRLTADHHMEFSLPVQAGPRLVAVAFTGSAPYPAESVPMRRQSIKQAFFVDDADAPGIDTVEISGPHDAQSPEDTPSRRRIFVCRPAVPTDEAQCAEQILSNLARRAYRRPVTEADLRPLRDVYAAVRREGDFAAGIERTLRAVLASPHFLLRIERDPADARPGSIYRLSDVELASRLSFFLWSSIPDEELLAVAEQGQLTDPVVLERQVRRMLADDRASTFISNFTSQWLITRNALLVEPDPGRFPDFDHTLRDAMVQEMDLFVESQVREDRSVLELLSADYTYLNERLAGHYGIPNVYGSHFRRVPLTDERRFGLLGKASVLMVTSYAHRTSVVLRGKWVLESLLGAPPPPPPPNVPPLEENDGDGEPASLRERMEQHRANPVCATCHLPMDPLGFVLEHFDATGQWREDDGGLPIDAASALADGTAIDGLEAFRDYLANTQRDEYVRTVTEKLLTYAIGRGVDYYDAPAVRRIVRDAAGEDFRWSSVISGVIRSTPFQMRRVPGGAEDAAGGAELAASR